MSLTALATAARQEKQRFKQRLANNEFPETSEEEKRIIVQLASVTHFSASIAINAAFNEKGEGVKDVLIDSSWLETMNNRKNECLKWLNEKTGFKFGADFITDLFSKAYAQFEHIPKEWKLFIVKFVIYSVIIFMTSLIKEKQKGRTWHEALLESFKLLIPTSIFNFFSTSLIGFINNDYIKSLIMGSFQELTEDILSNLCSGLVTFGISVFWDITTIILKSSDFKKSWNDLSNWTAFIKKLFINFCQDFPSLLEKSLLLASVSSLITWLCPVWITILLCLFLPALILHIVREKKLLGFNSHICTAGKLLIDVALYIPLSTWRIFVAVPIENCVEYPDDLCCEITFGLLTDPVFLNGFICNREVAIKRIIETGRDFNNTEVGLNVIKEMRVLAGIVRRVNM